jgi:hypothetical protein
LELEDFCLPDAGKPLVFLLLSLEFELLTLDPDELGLMLAGFLLVFDLAFDGRDFAGLLAEGGVGKDGGDDRASAEDRGEDGGHLRREDERHGGSLGPNDGYWQR